MVTNGNSQSRTALLSGSGKPAERRYTHHRVSTQWGKLSSEQATDANFSIRWLDRRYIMTHSIRCHCGRLKGTLQSTREVNRCLCYCTDCQAFAHYLKRGTEILDASGGSGIVQTLPMNIAFTEGLDQLACMRLTPKGLLRWYARCCNTAIGNTLPNFKFSFIGLIDDCLAMKQGSLDEAFGPVHMHVHTRHAKGNPKPTANGLPGGYWRVGRMILTSRLNGDYRKNPFFSDTGAPIATPAVLGEDELHEIKNS